MKDTKEIDELKKELAELKRQNEILRLDLVEEIRFNGQLKLYIRAIKKYDGVAKASIEEWFIKFKTTFARQIGLISDKELAELLAIKRRNKQ